MTAPSPALNDGAEPTLSITAGGKVVDTDRLVSVDVWTRINRIPRATLVLSDGDPTTGVFAFSESETFLPGTMVAISAGYNDEQTGIFAGVVVRHALDVSYDAPARLVVELADQALKMTLQRKSAVVTGTSDHALAAGLIAASGLSVGTNDAPSTEVEAIVQHQATDWDLLVTRAEANGLVVQVEAGEVSVRRPGVASTPVLTLEYGGGLLAFDGALDATDQLAASAVKGRSWSYTTRAIVETAAGEAEITGPGDVDSDTLAKVFGLQSVFNQTTAQIPGDALGLWSGGSLARARLSRITGRARFQGHAAARPGATVTLAGLGSRFNGDAYLSGVHHAIHANRWITQAEVGLGQAAFASETPDLSAPPASGLLPAVAGLQIGVVMQVHEDPAGDNRVLVHLPLIGEATQGVWARLGSAYASTGFGVVFFPEKGDEVILGFMNDDPRAPVILGSVYSSAHGPAFPPDAENIRKGVVTRSKIEISFDDKDVVFQIKTPAGRIITLDDKAEALTLKDEHGNSVVMDKGGIAIASCAELTITAKGEISITGDKDVSVQAGKALSTQGKTIESVATGKHTIKGAAGEIKISGPLTVAGSLVKIN